MSAFDAHDEADLQRLARCKELVQHRVTLSDATDEARARVDQAAMKIAGALAIDQMLPDELRAEYDVACRVWLAHNSLLQEADARWVGLLLGDQE